jgi:hypothetical protein
VLPWRWGQHWPAGQWWQHPPWNPRQTRAALLDLRRLFWRHRTAFSQFLVELEEGEKLSQPCIPHEQPLSMAA